MSIFDPLYRQKHLSGKTARYLFTVSKAIKHLQWEKSKLENLTPTQIESLLFLNYIRPEAATVNILTKYLSCKPSTVSGILDALERKRLVIRSRKSLDRRKVSLSLTPKGIRSVKVIEDLGKEIEEIITEFDKEEQGVLERILLKISKRLSARGFVLISDMCSSCCFFKKERYPGSAKPHYCECLNILLSNNDIYKECPEYKESIN